MIDDETPVTDEDEEPSASPLEKASWLALIIHSLITTSIAVVVVLMAPPLVLIGAIAVLGLLVSLLLVGVTSL